MATMLGPAVQGMGPVSSPASPGHVAHRQSLSWDAGSCPYCRHRPRFQGNGSRTDASSLQDRQAHVLIHRKLQDASTSAGRDNHCVERLFSQK